ncbi:MAG TPA: ribosome biogenesis GTPase YlqF [Firmicutes bacterium]|nr:ribosome biogenesis GTPase YlqF [Bacillota bacterium]
MINWYPGHMASARRMLEENLKIIDAALILLDARLPYSSRNPDLDKLLKSKRQLYILNKADLADPEKTKLWLSHFRDNGMEGTQMCARSGNRKELLGVINRLTNPVLEKYRQRGVNKTVRLLVCGIPNSGKSTLINLLSGQSRAKTGDKPGVTRGKQWIKISEYLEFLDSPGLLWPRLDDQKSAMRLAYTGAINDDTLDKEELAFNLVADLSELYPHLLVQRYGVPVGNEPAETFDAICVKRGFVLKGGRPDRLRGAETILNELRSGRIGRITFEQP